MIALAWLAAAATSSAAVEPWEAWAMWGGVRPELRLEGAIGHDSRAGGDLSLQARVLAGASYDRMPWSFSFSVVAQTSTRRRPAFGADVFLLSLTELATAQAGVVVATDGAAGIHAAAGFGPLAIEGQVWPERGEWAILGKLSLLLSMLAQGLSLFQADI